MADFNYVPSTSTRGKDTARVTKISYGDSYEQRARYGINNVARSWDVSFQIKDGTDIVAIVEALTGFSGMPFSWVQPWPFAGQGALYWTCDEWEFEYAAEGGLLMGLSCTFVRAFVP